MLPTELLSHRQNGETIIPKRLPLDSRNLTLANDLIDCFQECVGKRQGELDRILLDFEG
ncbi:MAG: DUF790 family protein, partial [Desertifilum sp. SIO1I2]|nr:DUF790 family protein [Desertifilum sp. SIO1I2]